jgi:aryl-alcohol dehydrogenase-like predicted oxidoreductase
VHSQRKSKLSRGEKMSYSHNSFSFTGESVLPLGLGTHGHGHAFGGISRDESLEIFELICRSYPNDSKILIDTAPRYGHGTVETWIGEFLSSKQDRFLIATKGGRHIEPGRDNEKDFSDAFLRYDLENSLTRLRANRIFLYQLHNPSLEVIKDGTVFGSLEEFRRLGLIQWYGVSINQPEEGIAAIETCRRNRHEGLVALQVIYSVLNKENMEQLFQLASETQIAIVTREVMLRGFLSNKYSDASEFSNSPSAIRKLLKLYGKEQLLKCVKQVGRVVKPYNIPIAQAALRFSIQNPYVTVTLAGINRRRYFQEDWGALDVFIPPELLTRLNTIDDLRILPEA